MCFKNSFSLLPQAILVEDLVLNLSLYQTLKTLIFCSYIHQDKDSSCNLSGSRIPQKISMHYRIKYSDTPLSLYALAML